MVLPNGTINVLPGVYPVMSQLNLNVDGLTIKGTPGSMIVLESNIIPILCNANYITIDGLTITSNIPYPVEFIQIEGDYNQIVNCEIYGSNQSRGGDSSTWVINRRLVTQNSVNNLLIRNNIFILWDSVLI